MASYVCVGCPGCCLLNSTVKPSKCKFPSSTINQEGKLASWHFFSMFPDNYVDIKKHLETLGYRVLNPEEVKQEIIQ